MARGKRSSAAGLLCYQFFTTTLSFQNEVSTVDSFSIGSPRSIQRTRNSYAPRSFDDQCDVLVLGSGPAARSIASLLSVPTSRNQQLDVLLCDQRLDVEWAPNYGVWCDEWQAIVERYQQAGVDLDMSYSKLPNAIDIRWNNTHCFFGGSYDMDDAKRVELQRPYARVDKTSLRHALTTANYRTRKANHISKVVGLNIYEPAGSITHDATGTTIQLETSDKKPLTIRTKIIVDCTGHETKLLVKDGIPSINLKPGYQIAYGAVVDIEPNGRPNQIGPYDVNSMTLFDYRTDHLREGSILQKHSMSSPTFCYVMPLGSSRMFVEETSLVARPAVSFRECEELLKQRLAYHNITVKNISEIEHCYIPMGGPLPARNQRIVGYGGAAAMVHPSTGYHLCRCLMGAVPVAETIRYEILEAKSVPDKVAAAAYHAIWSPERIRQRNFAVFGGEFLMKQNVKNLRRFFLGFFRLPVEQWGGFLAAWTGLPNNEHHETWYARLWYGFLFLTKLPLPVAVDMLASVLTYTAQELFKEGSDLTLLQSVTPFFGTPVSYEYRGDPQLDNAGDIKAKQEAREMIEASSGTAELPNSFLSSAGTVPSDNITKVRIC